MERKGGLRRKGRYKFKKNIRLRGKISVSRFMENFIVGQKVHLTIESAYHKGIYHTRFMGKTGVVKAQRGKCYEIMINDGGKEKTLIVHPVHLKASK